MNIQAYIVIGIFAILILLLGNNKTRKVTKIQYDKLMQIEKYNNDYNDIVDQATIKFELINEKIVNQLNEEKLKEFQELKYEFNSKCKIYLSMSQDTEKMVLKKKYRAYKNGIDHLATLVYELEIILNKLDSIQ